MSFEQIAVVVDREAVDRVRVQRVGVRIGVEDEDRPRGRQAALEGVQVAEIESLVAERRAEAETGEVVRHVSIKHHEPCA